ncbi:hypothetical protein I316_05788 [Kwoniella heveanensis BCC8398]|uniref:Ricin B lectin domain-containing protein n=1 Tax=Kwoniella heveanensis BCC8398 TaxID=1296120 RepID=A0A1B9GNK6_9TREE|nr:hypothetical protein I316_05788 [Kwoniella heveanensis BCC8398]
MVASKNTLIFVGTAAVAAQFAAGAVQTLGQNGQCLGVSGTPSAGGQVALASCNANNGQQTSTGQQWVISSGNNAGVKLFGTNFCLDGQADQAGENAIIAECSGSGSQTWYLTGDDRVAITGGTQCLQSSGSNAQTGNCAPGVSSQAWTPTFLFDEPSTTSSASSAASNATSSAASAASSVSGGAVGVGGSATSAASGAVSGASSAVGSATSAAAGATSSAASAASGASSAAASAASGASSTLGSAVSGASSAAASAVSGASSAVESATAAAGSAAGQATSAAGSATSAAGSAASSAASGGNSAGFAKVGMPSVVAVLGAIAGAFLVL